MRRRRNSGQLTAEELEKSPNPGGNLSLLGYGIMKGVVHSTEQHMGLPNGSIFENVKDSIARVAQDVTNNVRAAGINPGLAGVGLAVGLSLLSKAMDESRRQREQQTVQPGPGTQGQGQGTEPVYETGGYHDPSPHGQTGRDRFRPEAPPQPPNPGRPGRQGRY